MTQLPAIAEDSPPRPARDITLATARRATRRNDLPTSRSSHPSADNASISSSTACSTADGRPQRGGSGPAAGRLRNCRCRSRAARLDATSSAAYRSRACRARHLHRHAFEHVLWCFKADGAGRYFFPHSAQRLRSSRPSAPMPGRLPKPPSPATSCPPGRSTTPGGHQPKVDLTTAAKWISFSPPPKR